MERTNSTRYLPLWLSVLSLFLSRFWVFRYLVGGRWERWYAVIPQSTLWLPVTHFSDTTQAPIRQLVGPRTPEKVEHHHGFRKHCMDFITSDVEPTRAGTSYVLYGFCSVCGCRHHRELDHNRQPDGPWLRG